MKSAQWSIPLQISQQTEGSLQLTVIIQEHRVPKVRGIRPVALADTGQVPQLLIIFTRARDIPTASTKACALIDCFVDLFSVRKQIDEQFIVSQRRIGPGASPRSVVGPSPYQ